jgi:MoaA/NifB/PqqE/SkfB family radical SAM enzyme
MKQEDIAIEDFVRALDNFPSVRAIALVGEGEPLMHTGFFEMARIAADRGIRVVLSSNGSTLSSANVRKLCESRVAYVSVSIDSDDPAQFAASRSGGKLDQVVAGIRRLADYRDQHGFAYPRIGIKGTLFSATRDRLPRIVELAKAAGADIFEGIQALNPMRTYVPIYPQDHLDELAHVDAVSACVDRDQPGAMHSLRSIASFCAAEGIPASNHGRPNGLRPNCDEEWIYSLLSGDVTPCCQVKTPIDPAWNLFRSSIDDILADRHYENVRFNLWNGLFPDYCSGCWKTRK